jgi:hypothetical protein
MTKPNPDLPFRQRPILTRKVVVWTAMGALSAGYLGLLLVAPDWLDDLRPSSHALDPQSNQGQRAAARLASDVGGLRDSVSKIQLDIAKIKTDVQGGQDRDRTLAGQLAALEQKIFRADETKIDAAVPQAEGALPPQSKPPADGPTAIQAGIVTPPAPFPAIAEAKIINGDPGASVTTGQVLDPANPGPAQPIPRANTATAAAAAGLDFGTAIVKPARKPLGVKLASGASIDALRLSWSLLAENHGNALKSLEAHYVTSGDPHNPSYELIAGPIKSNAEAKRVCKVLAARKIPCAIGDFTGESL